MSRDSKLVYKGEFAIDLEELIKMVPTEYLEEELMRRMNSVEIYYCVNDALENCTDEEIEGEYSLRLAWGDEEG